MCKILSYLFVDCLVYNHQFPIWRTNHTLKWEGVWRELGCLARTASFAVREESGHSLKSSLSVCFFSETSYYNHWCLVLNVYFPHSTQWSSTHAILPFFQEKVPYWRSTRFVWINCCPRKKQFILYCNFYLISYHLLGTGRLHWRRCQFSEGRLWNSAQQDSVLGLGEMLWRKRLLIFLYYGVILGSLMYYCSTYSNLSSCGTPTWTKLKLEMAINWKYIDL